jgi:hypothetical protein
MRSLLKRFAFLGIAGTLAITAIAPASAATRHRAPAPNASSESYLTEAPVAARAPGYSQTGAVWRGPNECFTDEGYGRFSSCDAGGSQ